MPLKGFFSNSLRILGEPHLQLVPPSAERVAQSRAWSRAGALLGCMSVVVLTTYWFTAWLPSWAGYLASALGVASWLCVLQSRECLRSAGNAPPTSE